MSYPFEFLRARISQPDYNFAYVLYPFRGDGKAFCDDYVRPAVQNAGFKFNSAELITGESPILENILKGIADAAIVIGVLIDKNPNVLWEIGIAMTWKPPTQVLTIGREGKEVETLPFNIHGFRHLFVNPDNHEGAIANISGEIAKTVSNHQDRIIELVNSARNALGPTELKLLEKYGPRSSHFTLPAHTALYHKAEYCHPGGNAWAVFPNETITVGPKLLATHMDGLALGELCRIGLLACSTARQRTPYLEYSWYWTPLGNCVLEKLGLINSDEKNNRYIKMPSEIRNWRGGYLLNRGMTL